MKVKKRNWFARQLESEQFTTKQIIGMLIPLILDQLFIYMIGLLTTSMISSSGEDSVTAVSLVTPVVTLITAVFTALSSGGAIVVAQYKRTRRPRKVTRSHWTNHLDLRDFGRGVKRADCRFCFAAG